MADDPNATGVAYYSPGWPPGKVSNGIVTYVGNLLPSLPRVGIEPHVLTSGVSAETETPAIDIDGLAPPRIRQALFRAASRSRRLKWGGLEFGWRIAAAIDHLKRRHRVDLLEMEESFGAAWHAQQLLDIPVVVRLHGPWFLNGAALGERGGEVSRFRERAEQRCISEAVGVTAPSQDVLDRTRRELGKDLKDAVVIPYPVTPVEPGRRWRLDACDRKTILFVGRFDKHKGGDLVIDAFAEIAAALPAAELVFVGPDRGLRDGTGNVTSLPDYLSARLPQAVRSRVHILGQLSREEVEIWRRRAYLTVVASRYETFCLAMAEAMAVGCPTISADAGAIPEILVDGRNGLLFKTGEASDLARQVITLHQAPERAAQLGRDAAEDIARRYSPDVIARITADYYASLPRHRVRPNRARVGWPILYSLTGIT